MRKFNLHVWFPNKKCLWLKMMVTDLRCWWRNHFRIFEPSEWNLNLNRSDCIASKIIPNDTKLELTSLVLSIQNQTLNFCVGVCVCVGGHHRTNFSYRPKYSPEIWNFDLIIKFVIKNESEIEKIMVTWPADFR